MRPPVRCRDSKTRILLGDGFDQSFLSDDAAASPEIPAPMTIKSYSGSRFSGSGGAALGSETAEVLLEEADRRFVLGFARAEEEEEEEGARDLRGGCGGIVSSGESVEGTCGKRAVNAIEGKNLQHRSQGHRRSAATSPKSQSNSKS